MRGRQWAVEPPDDPDNPPADPQQVARTIALRRLEAAPRTRAQLATTLRERNIPDDVALAVLDRFEEVGLIDDRTFARMWVESRQRTRNLSARALRMELRTRGVADDLISDALETLTAEDELSAARVIAARKARSVQGLPRSTAIRRMSGALGRKGYGAAVTAQVVREALDEVDDDSPTPWT
ncbi:MAG: recombination regulator RecX [Actinomycetota bacterium]|nr:recombination regulator RecX [Actinomycetota bacterium]